jgi:hypothetical protein
MTTEAAAEPRIHELLLENLFAVFGERDPERRLEAIARNYTEDVIWTDPDGTTHGHEALNEGAQKLLDRMPELRVQCRRAGPRQPRPGPSQLQPRGAGAAAGGQRHRRGPSARWTDRRVAHTLDR